MPARKYLWIPEQDLFIRQRYDIREKNRSKEIGSALGVPRWAVNRRAADLGLSRPKERFWSLSDVHYLETHYHKTQIKKVAKKLGRSVTAVRLKSKRVGYQKKGEGYTATSLAVALGVDIHWVSDRIARGLLHATRRGTERTPQQGGDMLLITNTALVRFLRNHTFEIDLRKVDHFWFLDLVHEALAGSPERVSFHDVPSPALEMMARDGITGVVDFTR